MLHFCNFQFKYFQCRSETISYSYYFPSFTHVTAKLQFFGPVGYHQENKKASSQFPPPFTSVFVKLTLTIQHLLSLEYEIQLKKNKVDHSGALVIILDENTSKNIQFVLL